MAKNPLECPTRAVEWCGHAAYAAHPLASVRHRSWLVTEHRDFRISGHWDELQQQGQALQERGSIWQITWRRRWLRGQHGDPGSSPTWRRCQPPSNLSNSGNETIWKKDLRGSLRTLGTAREPPHHKGGLTCECMWGHMLARDSTYGSRDTAQLGGAHSERDNSLGRDYVGSGKREYSGH
jgi:hypothetical protein